MYTIWNVIPIDPSYASLEPHIRDFIFYAHAEHARKNIESFLSMHLKLFRPVFWIRIRIHMFLGLPDPDPDPLVRGMDPDPAPDPSITMQK